MLFPEKLFYSVITLVFLWYQLELICVFRISPVLKNLMKIIKRRNSCFVLFLVFLFYYLCCLNLLYVIFCYISYFYICLGFFLFTVSYPKSVSKTIKGLHSKIFLKLLKFEENNSSIINLRFRAFSDSYLGRLPC